MPAVGESDVPTVLGLQLDDVVHMRVLHPGHRNLAWNDESEAAYMESAENRQHSIQAAETAIRCAASIDGLPNFPLDAKKASERKVIPKFVMSDSGYLVQSMYPNLAAKPYNAFDHVQNTTIQLPSMSQESNETQVMLQQLQRTAAKHGAISRAWSTTVAHLDKPGYTLDEYMLSFIDMVMGMQARCVVVGFGRFLYFSHKLGHPMSVPNDGVHCVYRHEQYVGETAQNWGLRVHGMDRIPLCNRSYDGGM